MKKILLAFLLVFISGPFLIFLRTLDYQPACMTSPGMYIDFVHALKTGNQDVVNLLMQNGCGFVHGGLDAEIIEEDDSWIKVRIYYKSGSVELYMGKHSLEKVGPEDESNRDAIPKEKLKDTNKLNV